MTDPLLLFVYGTLRRGSNNLMAERLASEATYVGDATVAGVLYDTGAFAACVASPDPADRVFGEVWALRASSADALLVLLDQYEGFAADERFGSLFLRMRVPVRFEDGSEGEAWIYQYNESLHSATPVPSGDWMQR